MMKMISIVIVVQEREPGGFRVEIPPPLQIMTGRLDHLKKKGLE